jgi:hypothetical protein
MGDISKEIAMEKKKKRQCIDLNDPGGVTCLWTGCAADCWLPRHYETTPHPPQYEACNPDYYTFSEKPRIGSGVKFS